MGYVERCILFFYGIAWEMPDILENKKRVTID